MNRFKIRTEVRFNKNALDTLKEFKGSSAVVFTDKFMVKSGMINKILDKMDGYKNIAVFDEITPDPDTKIIADGLKFITKNQGEIRFITHRQEQQGTRRSTAHLARRYTDTNIYACGHCRLGKSRADTRPCNRR